MSLWESSATARRHCSSLEASAAEEAEEEEERGGRGEGLGLLRVRDWKMDLMMRLGLEMKEGLLLLLVWLSRGTTENLSR